MELVPLKKLTIITSINIPISFRIATNEPLRIGTNNVADFQNPPIVAGIDLKTKMNFYNVDNTSDVNKPVSTAQQTALDIKADKASPTFTGIIKTDNLTVNTSSSVASLTASGTITANNGITIPTSKGISWGWFFNVRTHIKYY